MYIKLLSILIAGVLFLSTGLSLADEAKNDDELINQTIKQYFEALNQHDTASAIKYFVRDAEYIATSGDKIKGVDKIRKHLGSFFKDHESAKINPLGQPRILPISRTKAVARGVVQTKLADDRVNEVEYTAMLSKENNLWKISQIEDQQIASLEGYSKLSDLAWLVGNWIDENGDEVVETKFEWAPRKSFINGRFKIKLDGNIALEGTQVIGWDPVSKTLRSWVFDSQGGIGHGIWSKDMSGWAVTMVTSLPDGRKASAINIFRPYGPDRFVWKSIGREISGLPLPNIEDTVIVRNVDQKNKQDKN